MKNYTKFMHNIREFYTPRYRDIYPINTVYLTVVPCAWPFTFFYKSSMLLLTNKATVLYGDINTDFITFG